MKINMEWLGAFVTFAEHMNLTKAAEAMHLSQPALHAQIRKLSEQLGVPLYVRRGRRLVLTAEGERAAAFGREVMGQGEAFVASLRGGGEGRPVVLAAGEGSYLYLLGGAIGEFLECGRAPLRLLTMGGEEAAEAVRSGRASMGVAAFDLVPEGLDGQLLASVGLSVAVRADHRLSGEGEVSLGSLQGEALVVPPPDRPHRRALEVALREAGVSWRVSVEASGWALMLHFVGLGLGVAVVNAFCRPPEGVVLRPLEGLARQEYLILTRRGGRLDGAAADLRARMLASAAIWRSS